MAQGGFLGWSYSSMWRSCTLTARIHCETCHRDGGRLKRIALMRTISERDIARDISARPTHAPEHENQSGWKDHQHVIAVSLRNRQKSGWSTKIGTWLLKLSVEFEKTHWLRVQQLQLSLHVNSYPYHHSSVAVDVHVAHTWDRSTIYRLERNKSR